MRGKDPSGMFRDFEQEFLKFKRRQPSLLKGSSGKLKVKINPRTGEKAAGYKYNRIACEQEVPMKTWRENVLLEMGGWYYDGYTSEAVIHKQRFSDEITRIFDPLQLVNLYEVDMKRLHSYKIDADKMFIKEAAEFQKTIGTCIKNEIWCKGKGIALLPKRTRSEAEILFETEQFLKLREWLKNCPDYDAEYADFVRVRTQENRERRTKRRWDVPSGSSSGAGAAGDAVKTGAEKKDDA
jgi:hypothetical protein